MKNAQVYVTVWRIPHQTLSERRATLHTSYGCKAIKTWRPKPWWKSSWNETDTLLLVLADKQKSDGLAVSLSRYFLTELVLCLLLFSFFPFCFLKFLSENNISIFIREEETFLADACRFIGLLAGFRGQEKWKRPEFNFSLTVNP